MATKKEVLQEQQRQILQRVDFFRRAMASIKQQSILNMYQQKIDALLDSYNELQHQIDQYEESGKI